MKAAELTRLAHSRLLSVGVVVAVLAAAVAYVFSGMATPIVADKGVLFLSPSAWVPGELYDFLAALASAGAIILGMEMLCKVHNVLRSMSALYLSLFMLMEIATPNFFVQLYSGQLLALVMVLSLMLIMNCFKNSLASPHVFLIFLMLSGFATTQYCFLFYVPSFLLACAQMRVFNGRVLMAALLGLITPWWILLGGGWLLGLVSPESLHMPDIESIFSVISVDDTIMILVAVGVTILCSLTTFVLNVLRTIAYNARSRAVNGVITLMWLTTIVAMLADYRNMIAYITTLNVLSALIITHFFATHRSERSFVGILIIMVVYIALYICQILL